MRLLKLKNDLLLFWTFLLGNKYTHRDHRVVFFEKKNELVYLEETWISIIDDDSFLKNIKRSLCLTFQLDRIYLIRLFTFDKVRKEKENRIEKKNKKHRIPPQGNLPAD